MSVTIPVPHRLTCPVSPANDTDVTNKAYVDTQINSLRSELSDGEGLPGNPVCLTDSDGVCTASCPSLSADTFISLADSLAPAYSGSSAYEVGDLMQYKGRVYKRTGLGGQSGLTPEMAVNPWTEVNLAEELLALIPSGLSVQRRALRTLASAVNVDLSGDASVLRLTCSAANITLMHIPSLSNPFSLSYWGSAMADLQFLLAMSVQAASLTWNGQTPVWIRGGVSDLTPGNTHLVRLRIIPQLSMSEPGTVLAELVGSFPTVTY